MNRLLLSIICLSLIGCIHAPIKYQTHMDLQPGMSKQQVLAVLGPPRGREVYQKYNDVMVEYLIYDHFQRYEDKTPICFINNKIVGWGKTFYQDHVSSDDKRLK